MEGKSGRFSLILVDCARFRWILVDYDWFSLIFIHFCWMSSMLEFQMGGKGRFWSILGGFGGVLGALGALWGFKSAFRTGFRGRRMEEGVRRGRKAPQETSKGARKGPESFKNDPQRVQNWELKVLKRVVGRNIRKTSKSTTLSSENRDFGGTEGRKLTQNWTKIRCRTFVSSIET